MLIDFNSHDIRSTWLNSSEWAEFLGPRDVRLRSFSAPWARLTASAQSAADEDILQASASTGAPAAATPATPPPTTLWPSFGLPILVSFTRRGFLHPLIPYPRPQNKEESANMPFTPPEHRLQRVWCPAQAARGFQRRPQVRTPERLKLSRQLVGVMGDCRIFPRCLRSLCSAKETQM